MEKLVCDRCGLELTEPEDIDLAFAGRRAWEKAARGRGIKPRGILPCKNYIRCGGEIHLVKESTFVRGCRRLGKALKRPKDTSDDGKRPD
jgi:hypothetical protein